MAKPTLALIPASQGSKLFSVLPSSGVGDFDFTRYGSATRINSLGLIEDGTSNQSRLNYPLIDGKVVGCPHHILEPARTNLVTYSEDFSNPNWIKQDVTISSNSAISPDGSLNASLLTEGVTVSNHKINSPSAPVTTGLTYTFSVFVKNNGADLFSITAGAFGSLAINSTFNLVTQTSASLLGSSTIKKIGDYFLCTATGVSTQTRNQSMLIILNKANIAYPFSYQGDGTSGIYIYGAQVEAGSYPTSYIPTNGAAVTRSAETANGAGDATTFNDSEGVLMIESSGLTEVGTNQSIAISDGSISNRILFRYNSTNQIRVIVISGSVFVFDKLLNISSIEEYNKFVIKYKQNDFALWVNGFELGTDNSGVTPAGLSELALDDGSGINDFYGNTKQIQYYNSALTDSELEQLTSWISFTDMANGQQYTIE